MPDLYECSKCDHVGTSEAFEDVECDGDVCGICPCCKNYTIMIEVSKTEEGEDLNNNPLKKKEASKKVHLLIDADSLVFRAAHVANKEEEKQEVKGNKFFEEEHMNQEKQCPLSVFDSMLSDIVKYCEVNFALEGTEVTGFTTYYTVSERYAICDDLAPNFRMAVWADYKGCRSGMPLPTDLEAVFNHAVMLDHAILCAGKEADDVVAYEKNKDPEGTVMVALDKDLLYGVPGRHLNFNKYEMIETTEAEAIRYPYIQCIEGDSSDCYKGVKGVGKVGARKAITEDMTDEVAMWKIVEDLYAGAGQTKEDALVTMRLASMNQWNGEEIILWNPKK